MKDADLDVLIEEATVDCCSEEEDLTGFASLLGDNLSFPFEARLGGKVVTVKKIVDDNQIIKVRVQSGEMIFPMDILDLEILSDTIGAEWIAAYKKWRDRK